MNAAESGAPAPGPWEPIRGLRFPLALGDVSGADREAVRGFAEALVRRLGTESVQFAFDQEGGLQWRDRDGRQEQGRVERPPHSLCEILHAHLATLALEPPPPVRPWAEAAPPGTGPIHERRRAARGCMGWLFPGPAPGQAEDCPGASAAVGRAAEAARRAYDAHFLGQLAALDQWLEERSREGALLPALREWQQQALERERPLLARVGPGQAISLDAPRTKLRASVRPDGGAAAVAFAVRARGARMELHLAAADAACRGADLSPALAGLYFHLLPCGLEIRGGER